jgi:peptidoglycan/LPS O-acetylase OafA/YrhL
MCCEAASGMDRRGEIASLTGLRGLAALLVVIGHFSVWTIVAPRAEMPTWIAQWGGATPGIGMSIFFTLSGYVIALSYAHWNWRERPGFNLVRFFFYRFARLYPAFFVFAILIVVRSPPLRDLSNPEAQAYLAPHLLLWQSWLPVKYGGALVADDLFHVSWSLSAECGLYFLFGIGAIVVAALPPWQWKSRVVALVFIATAFALLQTAWVMRGDLAPDGWSSGDWYLWLFAFSAWGVSIQFGIGVAAYLLSSSALFQRFARMASDLGAAGLVAIYTLCALGIVWEQTTQAIVVSLATAALMVGSRSSSWVNRLLTQPGILYVGTISYSLYLFHFLAPSMGFSGSMATFNEASAAYSLVNFVLSLALAIIIATGVYRLVEVPGRGVIRSAADKLLCIRRAPMLGERGAPAE